MEDVRIKKRELRFAVAKRCQEIAEQEYKERSERISERLQAIANFQESKTILMYASLRHEPDTASLLSACVSEGKVVLLPVVHAKKCELYAFRVENLAKDLREGPMGRMEPDPRRCKHVPLSFIDLAIIPGTVFDERGGRMGDGLGVYDRLIPNLPMTTRKVALSLEIMLVPQVPMEAHDRFVDIIITEDRVIYKI
ncbi:MAG: 5-formyltetrahydrofolate cyclo-ligase [Thermodesulfobacteriota bacterium]